MASIADKTLAELTEYLLTCLVHIRVHTCPTGYPRNDMNYSHFLADALLGYLFGRFQFLNSDNCHKLRLNDMINVNLVNWYRHERRLFDFQKVYMLVGGMGSLELQIAPWLYQVWPYLCPTGWPAAIHSLPFQNGALHISLTSRAKLHEFFQRGDVMAKRLLEYWVYHDYLHFYSILLQVETAHLFIYTIHTIIHFCLFVFLSAI